MRAYHDRAGYKTGLRVIIMVLASRISTGVDVSKSTVIQIICSAQITMPILLQALIEYLMVGVGQVRRLLLSLSFGQTSGHLPRFLPDLDQIFGNYIISFNIMFFQRSQNYSFLFQTIDPNPVYRAALSPAHSSSISKPVCKFYERR